MRRPTPLFAALLPMAVLCGCASESGFDLGSLVNPEDGQYWLWTLGDTPVAPAAAPGSVATGHGFLPLDYGTVDDPVTLVFHGLQIWSFDGDQGTYRLELAFCLASVGAGEVCQDDLVRCIWSGAFTRQAQNDVVTLSMAAVEPEVTLTGWVCPLSPASWTATYSSSIHPGGASAGLTWLLRADGSAPQGEALFRQLS